MPAAAGRGEGLGLREQHKAPAAVILRTEVGMRDAHSPGGSALHGGIAFAMMLCLTAS